jgi:hypothetical protein
MRAKEAKAMAMFRISIAFSFEIPLEMQRRGRVLLF